jgi:hypothetical protein
MCNYYGEPIVLNGTSFFADCAHESNCATNESDCAPESDCASESDYGAPKSDCLICMYFWPKSKHLTCMPNPKHLYGFFDET